MRRIVVTGGAGFIGSVLVKRLFSHYENRFDQLTVVDSLTYAGDVKKLALISSHSKFELKKSDLAVMGEIEPLIRDGDLIFHLAAESHVDNSIKNGSVFWHTNLIGTTNILEIMKQRKDVRLIYVSTDEVYGSINEGSFTETSSLNPTSPYSASKAAADLACLAYLKTHNLDLNITRCSNNFGIEQNSEKFLPVIVKNIRMNHPIPIYGDGRNVREWIPAWVHAEYLIRLMYSDVTGEIFNIGSGFEIDNLKLVQLAASTIHKEFSIELTADRKAHDFRYSIDHSKMLKYLGTINYDVVTELKLTIANMST